MANKLVDELSNYISPHPSFLVVRLEEMEHEETGCRAPEGPILCINNCGFFGSSTMMNMCSKCHKEMVLKQEQAKLAASSIENMASSIENMVNGSLGSNKEPIFVEAGSVETKAASSHESSDSTIKLNLEIKKPGPDRCSTCRKRVSLMGFSCKCGNLFCAAHRYSDKHNCPFDYRAAAQDALAKANPLIKAEKLDKI